MTASRPRKGSNLLRAAAGLAVLWAVPAALSASQMVLQFRGGAGTALSWWRLFLAQLPVWLAWVPLTAIVVWLARRFPLRRTRLARAIALHSAAALGVGVVYHALLAPFLLFQEGLPPTPANLRVAIFGNFLFGLQVDFLVYWVIAGCATAWSANRRLRDRELQAERLRAELVQARLLELHRQLQPHFLFNALHSVAGLVRTGDSEQAVRMLARIGDLLRETLDLDDRLAVPLHEEMEALERYLEIAEVRFGDRLRSDCRVAAEAAMLPVPPMLLQPLVENALRHGIEQDPKAGRIEVHARIDGEYLLVEVGDDGPGPRLPIAEGLGLRATRERLDAMYGGEARLEVVAPAAGGALARVRIPWPPAAGTR